jgi:short-subunit dehydrogenase
MTLSDKRILVIGGSGVLGAELVRQLRAKGATVLASATSNETAAKIPHGAEVRLICDFKSTESIQTLSDYLNAATQFDGIINAAGVVAFGPAAELTIETLNTLMAVNASGPIQLISSLHPVLKTSAEAGREPFVLNVTGVVAEQPMQGLAAYSASKTAIDGFFNAITREWRRDGIKVISTYPGHTETGLASRAIEGTAPNFPQGMTPEHVVERLIVAIENSEAAVPASSF